MQSTTIRSNNLNKNSISKKNNVSNNIIFLQLNIMKEILRIID